ncbi:hypothetical protein RND81_01G146500 [Saponaria officinalis]|uniref:UBA domain-containing protein n=1 Tax=Saponaria officinalis TaxID=3572 RepID=A0AAW1NH62_SAPOF
MAVPEVNKRLLEQLEEMGFPFAGATRALYYSGNSGIEDAITWIVEHENDPDIDQLPLVPVDIDLDASKPFHVTEEVKVKASELRNAGRQLRKDKEKELEREREKERIRAGKELLDAKRIAEENARMRMIASIQAEKEEERRARQRIRQKLEADKAERRSNLGLPPVASSSIQLTFPKAREKSDVSKAVTSSTQKAELLSDCLRNLRRNHKGDDARVKRAFQTLYIYVNNVMKNPDVEKFRKIRVTNPVFQERVGSLTEAVRFLELCGFERTNTGQFLYLPREKVELITLNSAITALHSAMNNPYFGLLSAELP